MSNKTESLYFLNEPNVTFATNTFVKVPVILQYEDTPLIEIVRDVKLGFTSNIPIYHSDGTYLAKAIGTRAFTTKEGEKANVRIEKHHQLWVCKMENQILFEIKHQSPESFEVHAELYTPDGYLLKSNDKENNLMSKTIGILSNLTMQYNQIGGFRIGILVKSDGSVALGSNYVS